MDQLLGEDERFYRLPGAVEFFKGRNQMPYVQLTHPSGSTLQVYLHGAHVTSWRVRGEEQLFLSENSLFQEGKAIRGGIPICWPQFSNSGPLPNHGFVRDRAWTVRKSKLHGGDVTLLLTLADTDVLRAIWPHCFRLDYELHLEADSLRCLLRVRNEGTSPFEFSGALHTYFRLHHGLPHCSVHGLQNCTYIDKVQGGAESVESREAVRFEGETDRIFRNTPAGITLHDGTERSIQIQKSATFSEVVLWNIGHEKVRSMPDLLPEQQVDQYVCVESANFTVPRSVLAPKGLWEAMQLYTVSAKV